MIGERYAPITDSVTLTLADTEYEIAVPKDAADYLAGLVVEADVRAAFLAVPTWAADLMDDDTHPNDDGFLVIADVIADAWEAAFG